MNPAHRSHIGVALSTLAIFAAIVTACGKRHNDAPAPYIPLSEVEATYGRLITAGNHPTPGQHGTGERVGIFQDAAGDVWGLPLTIGSDGAVLACAPPHLRDAKITGIYPAGATVVGATNEPTGWRSGTGNLELLLRDSHGIIHWHSVHSAELEGRPVCWAPESPGPAQQLRYYRLAPIGAGNP
jgi:hypothetical protein